MPGELGGHLPHVDGLRAVAVLSVLAFHAGLPFASGGYVGVDIFFVISGFVIARLIKREIERNRFSLFDFWRRRVRRLLPAYGPVFLVTIAACWIYYLPDDLERVGRSAIAVSFFSSNFLFWRESGYFATEAELKPLLHTWSLAVEEQFYLIFPLLFPLILRNRMLSPWIWIAVLALGSLCTAEILLRVDPSAAFYMLPSRAWELALGILLVFLPSAERHSGRVRSAVTVLGLSAMAAAIVMFEPKTPFPGIAAMLPCLGAAAAIWAGSTVVARRALEIPPAQFFGKISYGLYLWHWPLLAVWRYHHFGALSMTAAFALLTAATIMAWASYTYVEQPFRTGRFKTVPASLIALFVSGSGALAGLALILSDGAPWRYPREIRDILQVKSLTYRKPGCMSGRPEYRPPEESCSYGDPKATPSIAVWGDSHAHAIVDTFGEQLAPRNRSVRFLGTFACPPAIAINRASGTGECSRYSEAALDWLTKTPDIRHVVIFARHSGYLYGAVEGGPLGQDEAMGIELLPHASLPSTPLDAGYFARLDRTVATLRRAGKKVVFILPVPETTGPVPEILALKVLRGEAPSFDEPISLYRRRQNAVRLELARIAGRHGAKIVDPAEFLCDRTHCHTAINGRPLYYDDDHLSRLGASILSRRLVMATSEPASPPSAARSR